MLAVGGRLLGHPDPYILRMTTGFAGGVGGSKQEMCGALSAGVMIIGALHGRSSLAEDSDPARQLATHYRELFAAEFGTTRCSPLYEQVNAPVGLAHAPWWSSRLREYCWKWCDVVKEAAWINESLGPAPSQAWI
jgi:C_GCAxxG_C_C family probable redox protein